MPIRRRRGEVMGAYKITYDCSIVNGLGYHLRDEQRTKIFKGNTKEEAKEDFLYKTELDESSIVLIEEIAQ